MGKKLWILKINPHHLSNMNFRDPVKLLFLLLHGDWHRQLNGSISFICGTCHMRGLCRITQVHRPLIHFDYTIFDRKARPIFWSIVFKFEYTVTWLFQTFFFAILNIFFPFERFAGLIRGYFYDFCGWRLQRTR